MSRVIAGQPTTGTLYTYRLTMDLVNTQSLQVLLAETKNGQVLTQEQVARFWRAANPAGSAPQQIPGLDKTGLAVLVLLLLVIASRRKQSQQVLKSLMLLSALGVSVVAMTPTTVEAQIVVDGIQVKIAIQNDNELIIEKYVASHQANQAPTANAGPDQTINA